MDPEDDCFFGWQQEEEEKRILRNDLKRFFSFWWKNEWKKRKEDSCPRLSGRERILMNPNDDALLEFHSNHYYFLFNHFQDDDDCLTGCHLRESKTAMRKEMICQRRHYIMNHACNRHSIACLLIDHNSDPSILSLFIRVIPILLAVCTTHHLLPGNSFNRQNHHLYVWTGNPFQSVWCPIASWASLLILVISRFFSPGNSFLFFLIVGNWLWWRLECLTLY